MNTKIDLDALEALLARATPGEWQYGEDHRSHWVLAGDDSIAYEDVTLGGHGPDRDDMRAIAALHNAAPALIAELRALQAANRWRPIAEAPPPNRVELWWPYWATSVQNGFLRENGRWCSSCVECDDPDLPGPTHWRPMSGPPEGA